MKAIFGFLAVLITAQLLFGQVDAARDAIDKGEYLRAVNILSDVISSASTPDAYLYLGIAYDHLKEFQKSEESLKEGSRRYPQDSRFHNQLADLYLEYNDREAAKSELKQSLVVDPNNNYASDLLATIDMSEGEVQSALRSWNKSGRPVIDDILHNYYLTFGSWVVRDAVAFHPAGILKYSQWKTTESRLFATENFANVGLEIEPTVVPDQYDAIVRTTPKTNSISSFLFGIFKGVPIQTPYVDFWNIGNSGINFNGNYRWETPRRRAAGQLQVPVPIAGLLHVELGSTWRDERWDVSVPIAPPLKPFAKFDYRATAMRIHVKNIPHYRVELGAGFEYRNRNARGALPQLFTNGLNTARFDAELSLRLIDGQYQNRLNFAGFAARRSVLGDTNFSSGTAELDNRFTISRDSRTTLDWVIKGGTSRGALPIEDYFLLGLDNNPALPLRGHTAEVHGQYGHGPMGTDFALVNTDLERRLATLPFFNTFNIPFLVVKWNLFLDGAKTWDRNRIFPNSKLLIDTGGGVRFETPTHSLNFIYGRALREGQNTFFVYFERLLWGPSGR
jgi:tetratricopeptide (TPR) repeat protein